MNPLIPSNGVYNISANRLSIFKECPYKLYLYLSHQITDEIDMTYINVGNAIHKYMEDNFSGCEVQSHEKYIEDFQVPAEMKDRYFKCVENAEKFLSLKGEPEVTEFTEFVTPKGRNINLQSRIDLQVPECDMPGMGKKVVIDWKTGKSLDKPGYKIQMHVYRFVKNQEYDAVLVSLLSGETSVINKSPKDYIPKLCDQYVDAIENNSFDRCESAMCSRFCQYYGKYCSPESKYDIVVPRMTWDHENKEWVE